MVGRSVTWPDAGPGSRLERRLLTVGSAAMLFLVALSLLLTAAFSPGSTVRRFRSAMDARDFSALSAVAVPSDPNTAFTQQAAEPLFRLWREDAQFRARILGALEANVRELRSGQASEEESGKTTARLLPRRAFLHTAYTVEIATGRAIVSSNLANAVLLLDSGAAAMSVGSGEKASGSSETAACCADYGAVSGGRADFRSLLPGIYSVTGRYTTAYGETFEASGTMTVYGGVISSGALRFDCCSLDVYNEGQTPTSIWIGEREYWHLGAGAELLIGPLRPATLVTARPEAARGSGVAQSIPASGGSFCVCFDPCRIEIRNTYTLPITIWQGRHQAGTVAAKSSCVLDSLPTGTVLTLRLNGQDAANPWVYTCRHRSDYLCPFFSMSGAAKESITRTVSDYVAACFRAFNDGDIDALNPPVQTDLSKYLCAAAAAKAKNLTEGSALQTTFWLDKLSLGTYAFGLQEDGTPTVTAYFTIFYHCRSDSGSEEHAQSVYCFALRPRDKTWTVIPNA